MWDDPERTAVLSHTLKQSSMSTIIHNGQITNTFIGIEDHGILTAELTVSGTWGASSFGGWNILGRPQWIRRTLEVLESERWENLRHQFVRIKCDASASTYIQAIGHIVKDQWFEPHKEFQE